MNYPKGKQNSKENDKYILGVVRDAEVVIIGWIRGGKAFVESVKKKRKEY